MQFTPGFDGGLIGRKLHGAVLPDVIRHAALASDA